MIDITMLQYTVNLRLQALLVSSIIRPLIMLTEYG
jgi:hypothetical protein